MAFLFNSNSGKCIFAATGKNLKITSLKIPPFEVIFGSCELREVKAGTYVWQIIDANKRKKHFKFKTGKGTNIVLHNRDGQFTIVIKCNDETTQLIGKLDKREDCLLLIKTIDNIKNGGDTDNKWFCASKENIPKGNNSKENETPSLRSQMTSVMERNNTTLGTAKQPLSGNSSLKSVVGKNSLQFKNDTTPERVPLGDKPGPVLKNRTLGLGRLLPSPSALTGDKKSYNKNEKDSDIKITAFGGSKTSGSFYGGDKRTPERPKIRHTYSRKQNSSAISDNSSTPSSKNWSFRDRDDFLRIPKETTIDSPNVVGFSNLGNTCYMNSILQCLLNIPTFFQDLNNIDNLELVQHSSLYNSLCNLGILKYSYETLENQRFALQRVKNAISNAASRFSGHAQHDAHELLCQCLDQLKEDLYNETKKKHDGQNLKLKELEENGCANCPIKSNFESTILHSITCESCGEKVTKEEACHDFSLVIPDFDENTNPADQALDDLLNLYFDSELIEYNCEKCKGSYSVLSHQFSKLPRVLVVHIKRYDINDTKKTDRICIPKSIDIKPHTNSSTKSVQKFVYDKNKLKSKGEIECTLVTSSEKRKSPGQLDLEPVQKQCKSSISTSDDLEGDLEDQYIVSALDKNKKKVECKTMKNENKENSIKDVVQIPNEVHEETIAKALHSSNTFTKVKTTKLNSQTETKSVGTSSSNCVLEIVPDDNEDDPSGMGIYTSVLDDEDEELKKALDLSMREYEKSQIESYKEFEQAQTLNSKYNTEDQTDDVSDEKDKENLYMLVGIVNHHGQNTGTGHYTCDSFDFKSKKWRCYNDSSVKEINQHEVRFGRSHSAYIVFYMHNQCYNNILDAH